MNDNRGDGCSVVIGVAQAAFGRWCLNYMRDPAPGDINGGDAQDEAERLGLLVRVRMTPPCGENCPCLEYYGSGEEIECLREP